MKAGLAFLFIYIFTVVGVCQNINVKIFSTSEFSSFTFTVDKGRYQFVSNSKIAARIQEKDSVIVYVKGKKIRAEFPDGKKVGSFKHLQIRGVGSENYFSVRPHLEGSKSRQYDDDLQVVNDSSILKLVNDVNFEKYIGAVVECEGGPSSHIEYYKSQAILCRTYAMRHFEKHMDDGYSLCDDVHCQAYKHRCFYNRDIYKAAIETAGLVIVDDHLKLINATFYSNSGGQTANSEDVWTSPLPYLRSMDDPYSKGMRNFRWKKEIPLSEWKTYLANNGADLTIGTAAMNFRQPTRKNAYTYGRTSILTKKIRSDWKLKSAFFDVSVKGDIVVIDGKGYGHGVGLAQEGAMSMANKGFSYEDIVKHYYKGVNIMSVKALNFFQVEQ